jgi:hypothetical protein
MALPGEVRKHLGNDLCERCDAAAEFDLCTESDSFGDEWEPVCKAHLPDPNLDDIGDCDQCDACIVKVVPTRDPEEIHGPVSYLCPACLSRHRQYVRELNESYHDELDEYEEDYEDDDEDDEDVRTSEEQEEDVRKIREMISNELPRLIDEHNEHRSFSQFAPGELKQKVHKYPSKKDDE